MIDIRRFYRNKLVQLQEIRKLEKRRLKLFAFTRLILFVLVVLAIFVIVPKSISAGLSIVITCLVLFLITVKAYNNQNEKYKHTQALITVNTNEISAIDHDYSVFESGDNFIDHEHPYSYDMDLFGTGSLYQYLNRTVTFKGKELLASLLIKETLESETIVSRQKAVNELSSMIDLLQNFRAAGSFQKDESSDVELLKEWINKPVQYLSNKLMIFIARVFPVVLCICIVLSFFLPVFRSISILLFLTNLLIVGTKLTLNSREHGLISKHLRTLRKYAVLFSIIEKVNYKGQKLNVLYDILISGSNSASKSILSLSQIISAFDNRLNILAAIFLEGILLWDIQCMLRLEKWRKQKGIYFEEWMDKLAEFDAYTSLATFAFNHPSYVYPEISMTTILETKSIGHFLIPSGQRVCNDFKIAKKGEFRIITGANMAGKSTFLRTIATNLVMAMAGAPVCAEKLIFKPMIVFSSMRTSDSLNKNESYFYAELKRLKEMLDRLKKGDDLFIILDEILKGTNSLDKQKGSRSALKQILKYKGTGIIATHDLALAGIESEFPGQVKNLCFEIEIDNTCISFDYRLRKGITTKMNASLLMQQMGILEE
jgi:ABC-type multidrug transport system fused ATPase/permease subunit